MSDHSHRQVAIYPGVLPFRCSPSRRQDMHMTTRLNAFPTPSIYPVWAIINFVISIHLRMPLFWAMSPALPFCALKLVLVTKTRRSMS